MQTNLEHVSKFFIANQINNIHNHENSWVKPFLVTQNSKKNIWILDNGVINYIICNIKFLTHSK